MKLYKCPHCTYFSISRTSALAHIKNHKGAPKRKVIVYEANDCAFTCKSCIAEGNTRAPSVQKTLQAMRTHLARKHKISKPLSMYFSIKFTSKDGGRIVLDYDKTKIKNAPLVEKSTTSKDTSTDLKICNHAVIRVPVMLVIDLSAGTSKIESLDPTDLINIL